MGEYRRSHKALSERVVRDWLDRWSWWFDGRKQWSKEEEKKRDNTPNDKTTDVCWRVTLLVTVLWCDLRHGGQAAVPGLAVIDVTWYDAGKTWEDVVGGDGWLDQSPLLFLSSSHSLSLFLTHSGTQTSAVCAIHHRLPCSVNLICPVMLPPTFPWLLISFLSIQYSLLSHFLSRSCSISPSPQWTVSLSRSAEQRAWVRLQTSLQWIDKNRALVTAARWRERKGKRRDEDKRI